MKPLGAHLEVELFGKTPETGNARDRDYRSPKPETDSRPARGNIAVLYIERKRVEGKLQLPGAQQDYFPEASGHSLQG